MLCHCVVGGNWKAQTKPTYKASHSGQPMLSIKLYTRAERCKLPTAPLYHLQTKIIAYYQINDSQFYTVLEEFKDKTFWLVKTPKWPVQYDGDSLIWD